MYCAFTENTAELTDDHCNKAGKHQSYDVFSTNEESISESRSIMENILQSECSVRKYPYIAYSAYELGSIKFVSYREEGKNPCLVVLPAEISTTEGSFFKLPFDENEIVKCGRIFKASERNG